MSAALGVFDASNALLQLWERASARMQPNELHWFAAGAAEQVASDSRMLGTVLEGIGCLVQADGDGQGVGCGALQSRQEIADLVLFAANQAKAVHGMAEVATRAAGMIDRLQRCARGAS